ncbi:MAG: hypothetical protein AAGA66_05165 [Bacteroidota bacterium]
MTKTKLMHHLVLLFMLLACKKETKKSYLIERELDPKMSGAWMIDDFTFESDAEFKIGFVKGAGVSGYHDVIFYGYKNQELLEDENFYWKVNGVAYAPEEIAKRQKTTYHYSKGGEGYYGKNVKVEFFAKNNVLFAKENSYIPPPIEVEFRLNGEWIQPNEVYPPILNPRKDRVELNWNVESHDGKLMLMLVKSPVENKVSNPCYNIREVDQPWGQREIRYFFVEDTGKLTVDACFFEGILDDMIHEDDLVFLSLSRGNLHEFISDNQKFIIYDLSRSAIGFRIE